ncbi:MAG: FtsQ-type POTRA domain-containing protein [Gammaproteobacteria bacterium]|nr:FtsQ-type POTRA domain-containing protein [Gammaproteobacteria bacterium]
MKFILFTMVALILIVAALWIIRSSSLFPLRTVIISGSVRQIKENDLTYMVKPLVKGKNFFDINLYALAKQVEQLSWVERVEVRRVWPQAVAINVIPKRPVAQWNKRGFVDSYGEIFYASGAVAVTPDQLPQFVSNNEHNAFVMLGIYQQMARILASTGRQIEIVSLDSDNSWQITLNNGTKLVLGQQKILTRLRHFVKVYPKVIVSNNREARLVDLRYKDGMSVAWQGKQKKKG